jgi:hypothetical protein
MISLVLVLCRSVPPVGRFPVADGNFVSTTSIPNVSPSETFRSFFGVDAAVRVEYRDFGSKSSFSGVVFKHRVMTHKFATTIRCAASAVRARVCRVV